MSSIVGDASANAGFIGIAAAFLVPAAFVVSMLCAFAELLITETDDFVIEGKNYGGGGVGGDGCANDNDVNIISISAWYIKDCTLIPFNRDMFGLFGVIIDDFFAFVVEEEEKDDDELKMAMEISGLVSHVVRLAIIAVLYMETKITVSR
mmetsp:Transcript_37120/g.44773  ORF Transcript_37120/g.44773 Transcript_37120/m.44773 type:complete len:150 (-) Transcript_37120:119-568(-)